MWIVRINLNFRMCSWKAHIPKKHKFLRVSKLIFMKEDLRKAIKQRSKVGNKFLEDRTTESKHIYNKQRNKLFT